MVYCAKSKTAKKRTWCKKTPCAVDSDNKSCILDGKTNRCRARISKKALPKKKSSKIIKKTKKTEEVAEVLPAPPLRRSARLNNAKGGAPPPKPMSKKASRAKVFNNKDLVTPGGLSTKDLVKSNGRIVSKVKSKIGKKNSWALAVKKARKELKIDGFAVIKKGEPIYDLAMKYYKGSVGGARTFVEVPDERPGVACVKPTGHEAEAVDKDNDDKAQDQVPVDIADAVEEAIKSIKGATDLKKLRGVVTIIKQSIDDATTLTQDDKEALKKRTMNEVSKKRKTLLVEAMAGVVTDENLTQVLDNALVLQATKEELIEAYRSLIAKEGLDEDVKKRAKESLEIELSKR